MKQRIVCAILLATCVLGIAVNPLPVRADEEATASKDTQALTPSKQSTPEDKAKWKKISQWSKQLKKTRSEL